MNCTLDVLALAYYARIRFTLGSAQHTIADSILLEAHSCYIKLWKRCPNERGFDEAASSQFLLLAIERSQKVAAQLAQKGLKVGFEHNARVDLELVNVDTTLRFTHSALGCASLSMRVAAARGPRAAQTRSARSRARGLGIA